LTPFFEPGVPFDMKNAIRRARFDIKHGLRRLRKRGSELAHRPPSDEWVHRAPPTARLGSRRIRSSDAEEASVRVYVPSFNDAEGTELCIRSIHEVTDVQFDLTVGAFGYDEAFMGTLREFESRGWLSLEVADGRRRHADWLDDWLARCDTEYAVFSDSDIEFRKPEWLRQLLEAALETRAALVASEWVSEYSGAVEPVGQNVVRLAGRPAPWLMLVHVPQAREVDASFEFTAEQTDAVHEGEVAFDVSGHFFRKLSESGMATVTMPRSYARAFHHYANLSSISPDQDGVPRQKLRDLADLQAHLGVLRRKQEAQSLPVGTRS
jgi:hypothetical protein